VIVNPDESDESSSEVIVYSDSESGDDSQSESESEEQSEQ
jgi:hypothetical protein